MTKPVKRLELGIHLIHSGKFRARVDRTDRSFVTHHETIEAARVWREELLAAVPAGLSGRPKKPEKVKEKVEPDWRLIIKRFNLTDTEKLNMLNVVQFLTKHQGRTFSARALAETLTMKLEHVLKALEVLVAVLVITRTINGYVRECE